MLSGILWLRRCSLACIIARSCVGGGGAAEKTVPIPTCVKCAQYV